MGAARWGQDFAKGLPSQVDSDEAELDNVFGFPNSVTDLDDFNPGVGQEEFDLGGDAYDLGGDSFETLQQQQQGFGAGIFAHMGATFGDDLSGSGAAGGGGLPVHRKAASELAANGGGKLASSAPCLLALCISDTFTFPFHFHF